MNSDLFKHIIEITEQKDSNSLDYCVLATIAQILPCEEVSLFKNKYHNNELYLDATLTCKASYTNKTKTPNQHLENKQAFTITLQKEDEKFFNPRISNIREAQIYQLGNKCCCYVPIVFDKELVSAVHIILEKIEHGFRNTLAGITKIYENYLYILRENERDKLTGLLNRKTFEIKLNHLLKIQNYKQSNPDLESIPLAENREVPTKTANSWLVIVDIDHFKQVNDKYGHVYGDEVLLSFAQLLQKSFRGNDLLFRFGGEEFVIILEPMEIKELEKVLNRFHQTVAQHAFPMVGNITVSSGIDKISITDHPRTVFDNADKALYYSKEHGRNCFHFYHQLVSEGKIKLEDISNDIELF